jgi:hypothetical protein
MSDEKTWFVIGDKDFALLNDEEFAQVWAALSVVMRKRALAEEHPGDISAVRGVSS